MDVNVLEGGKREEQKQREGKEEGRERWKKGRMK